MKIYQVDAFTDQPFRGNPACVCVMNESQPDDWMRSLAQEMNLSETAFLLKQESDFSLRWFTPKREVSLCGHATLATAHILYEEQYLKIEEPARFHTQSGLLIAKKNGAQIEMDFPARFTVTVEANLDLNHALGTTPKFTHKASARNDVYLIEVESEQIVRDLAPDFALLANSGIRAVIVTSRSQTSDYDFVSRYFAPGVGVNEDPVTGSAHCYLAPYWETRLSKKSLIGFQASARTGIIECEWNGDRVILRGKAVTIFRGELGV
ncbi:MAG: PhzF family phenazine biosynthesis protein [Chloroflexi bacterium]|nr:PhzF family phenazine biosynthesis protein [Chloroflexota bacterium]